MKYYAGDLKNVLTVPIKYAVQPKADLKAEKEVEAKKDDKIEDLMKNRIVESVKGGEGGIDFFNKQKQEYPDYVPLYHVSFCVEFFLTLNFQGASISLVERSQARFTNCYRRGHSTVQLNPKQCERGRGCLWFIQKGA